QRRDPGSTRQAHEHRPNGPRLKAGVTEKENAEDVDQSNPSNSPVDRERSANDGRIPTIRLPAYSGRWPSSQAADNAAPEEMPTGRPSSFATLRAMAKELALETPSTSSITSRFRISG